MEAKDFIYLTCPYCHKNFKCKIDEDTGNKKFRKHIRNIPYTTNLGTTQIGRAHV